MGIKIHTLKGISPVQYQVFGIVSSESLLKVTMILNSILSISLKVTNPISRLSKEGKDECFSNCMAEKERFQIHIIKNKEEGKLLFQGQQAFDYIIALAGENDKDFSTQILSLPKNTQEISLVSMLEVKKLKNISEYLSHSIL